MKVVSISAVRQNATQLITEAERTHTPFLVLRRSRAAAYVVPAADYEAVEEELRQLRQQVFWHDVDEAWAEHQRGEGIRYDDVEGLISDLGLEETAARRPSRAIASRRTHARA